MNIPFAHISFTQVIVYPTRRNSLRLGAISVSLFGWLVSLVMASPMALFTTVGRHQVNHNSTVCSILAKTSERMALGKFAYGLFTLLVQYCLPITVTVYAYARICMRIQRRKMKRASTSIRYKSTVVEPQMAEVSYTVGRSCYETNAVGSIKYDAAHAREVETVQPDRKSPNFTLDGEIETLHLATVEPKRGKISSNISGRILMNEKPKGRMHRNQTRINALLAVITLTFVLSWLPWNILNVFSDFEEIRELNYLRSSHSLQTDLTVNQVNRTHSIKQSGLKHNSITGRVFILLHCSSLLCILCAACINPILYGWLNENFRKEFKHIFSYSICSSTTTVNRCSH